MKVKTISSQNELEKALEDAELKINLGEGKFNIKSDDASATTFIGKGDSTVVYLEGEYTETTKYSEEEYETFVFDAATIVFSFGTQLFMID